MSPLSGWSLILVSPKGALNVGGVARLMGNFGMKDLRLVDPRCDLKSVECKQMAMHSYSLVLEAKHYPTLADAVADRTQVIALSGRQVDDRRPASSLYDLPAQIRPKIASEDRVGLVFGREEIGLLLEELCLCSWQVQIPTHDFHPSINLTSAVAITLSWLFEQDREATPAVATFERPPREVITAFFNRLQRLLETVKFTNKENPQMLRDDLWALFHRTDLDERELRILFGILTAIESSVQRSSIDA